MSMYQTCSKWSKVLSILLFAFMLRKHHFFLQDIWLVPHFCVQFPTWPADFTTRLVARRPCGPDVSALSDRAGALC